MLNFSYLINTLTLKVIHIDSQISDSITLSMRKVGLVMELSFAECMNVVINHNLQNKTGIVTTKYLV